MTGTLADCLATDPFAGDFGGSGQGDRVLSDKLVRVRKLHNCHDCHETIEVGQTARSRAEVYDDEICQFYWCEVCCQAAADHDDDKIAMLVALGEQRRAEQESGQ